MSQFVSVLAAIIKHGIGSHSLLNLHDSLVQARDQDVFETPDIPEDSYNYDVRSA